MLLCFALVTLLLLHCIASMIGRQRKATTESSPTERRRGFTSRLALLNAWISVVGYDRGFLYCLSESVVTRKKGPLKARQTRFWLHK